jgi:hypothetical protein
LWIHLSSSQSSLTRTPLRPPPELFSPQASPLSRARPACSLADPLPLSTRTPRHRRKQFRFYPFFVCAWRAGEATWRDRENNRRRAACARRVQAAQALRQQRGAQGALRRARRGGSSSPTDGTTYRKVRTQISPPLPRRCFRIWWRVPFASSDEEHRGRYLHTAVH